MNYIPTDGELDEDADEELRVPEGVLRGIEDIVEGDTASKEEIESILKF